jgi:hypothetical protein
MSYLLEDDSPETVADEDQRDLFCAGLERLGVKM